MNRVEAKRDLFDLFAETSDGVPVPVLRRRVGRVFSGVPATGVQPKQALTIFTLASTPTDHRFRVAFYQSMDPDPLTAQDNFDHVQDAIEDLLKVDSRYGRPEWDEPAYSEELDSFYVAATVTVGRDDF